MKKKDYLLVSIFFILAYLLRVMFLSKLSLTFGYDQARDALVTNQILQGDFKILGPSASTPGLYHGVFYYYFLSPAYLFGKTPIAAAYWAALFNAGTVFTVFYLTYLLMKNKKTAFLAAFLFAISFEATQYATWLSNPTIAIWTVPLMYLGLWGWVSEKKKWGPVVTGIFLGLSIQSEIFLAYHLIPVIFWLIYSKKNVNKDSLRKFGVGLVVALSTMIVSEVKFGFKSIEGIKMLFSGAKVNIAYADSLGHYLTLYLNQIGRIFAFNSYPTNIGYGGALILILAIVAINKSGKEKKKAHWGLFLGTWLFSHATVVTMGGDTTPFLMVGIGPAVSILLAIFISKWWKEGVRVIAALVLGLLVYGNISMIRMENPRGSTLFAIQKDMLLEKQLRLLDYTYEMSEGEPFSINTLTSPLWINIVWTYLYDTYGQENYGYVPCFFGRDQVGQVAALPSCEKKENNHFLILEPMGGIPARHLTNILLSENGNSSVSDEVYFGELRVQKRKLNE